MHYARRTSACVVTEHNLLRRAGLVTSESHLSLFAQRTTRDVLELPFRVWRLE